MNSEEGYDSRVANEMALAVVASTSGDWRAYDTVSSVTALLVRDVNDRLADCSVSFQKRLIKNSNEGPLDVCAVRLSQFPLNRLMKALALADGVPTKVWPSSNGHSALCNIAIECMPSAKVFVALRMAGLLKGVDDE